MILGTVVAQLFDDCHKAPSTFQILKFTLLGEGNTSQASIGNQLGEHAEHKWAATVLTQDRIVRVAIVAIGARIRKGGRLALMIQQSGLDNVVNEPRHRFYETASGLGNTLCLLLVHQRQDGNGSSY